MATIQVRHLSEEAYEVIRTRARAAGQSIQAYMHDFIECLAREPDDDAFWAEMRDFEATYGRKLDIDEFPKITDEPA